ncbi:MAG: multiheme c-type cytochrome [Thermoanaerobaculia bacterium]
MRLGPCLVSLAVLCLGPAAGWAQVAAPAAPAPPSGAVAPPPAGGEPGSYLGVGSCVGSGCHGSPRPQAKARVLGNEYQTWLHQDAHHDAYNHLFDARSERIAANLKLGRASQAKRCLACHTVTVPAGKARGRLAAEDGVTCEGCHGPASGWKDGHTEPSWSHADSVAHGLTDLARPEVRAALCLGCHLGDATQSVDHELIAAGHPPLAFEVDNYAQAMPAHWKPNGRHGMAAWAVGQAASFRAGLAQLARRAKSDAWPEFAEMSCYACHHSLKAERWRRADAFRGRERPGLPPWSPARWAVLRLVVAAVAPGERPALDAEVRELAQAVERMSRPGDVVAAAERAGAALDRVLPAIAAKHWDGPAARALLAALAEDADGWVGADVHSAEQGFFAAQTLVAELAAGDPRTAAGPLSTRLNQLYQSLTDPEAFDRAKTRALLAEVAQGAR